MLEKGARKPSALLYSPLVPGTCSSSSPLLQTISHGANPDVPTTLPQNTMRWAQVREKAGQDLRFHLTLPNPPMPSPHC